MKLKKSEEANNERLRYPMIFTGLLFTGSLVLASFTYSTSAENNGDALVTSHETDTHFEEDVKIEEPETPEVKQQAPVTPPPQEKIIEKKTEPIPPPLPTPPAPPIPPAPVPQPVKRAEIVDFPDVEAAFPGGAAAMAKWIQENFEYPDISQQLGDEGRVYVTFVVEPDGSITGVNVLRGGVTDELNREAKRLVRAMPKWKAGEVKGSKIRARCRLPITFKLK